MIHASDLFLLVDEVVGSIVSKLTDDPPSNSAAVREALIEFAGQHDLGVQATATLFRVASGEAPYSPAYRLTVVDSAAP